MGKKKNQKGKNSSIGLVMTPALAKRLTLVYTAPIQITEASVGLGAFKTFRLNSLYDVDTSLGSTSMPGFAEWAGMYNNYRVHRTRFVYEGITFGESSAGYAQVSLVPNSFSTVLPANNLIWPVQPGAESKLVVPVAQGGSNVVRFDVTFDMWKSAKVTKHQFMNDMDYTASVGVNPLRIIHCMLCVSSGNSTTVGGTYGVVRIAMDCEFFNPVLLAT